MGKKRRVILPALLVLAVICGIAAGAINIFMLGQIKGGVASLFMTAAIVALGYLLLKREY